MKKTFSITRLLADAALQCALLCAIICALTSCTTAKFEDRSFDWTASLNERTNEYDIRAVSGTRTAMTGYAVSAHDGVITVTIDRIRWFNNWRDGWTEAEIAAGGTVTLKADESAKTGYRVITVSAIEVLDSPKARIRYRDELLSTADATTLFNRRLGRIIAAVQYLRKEHPDARTYSTFSSYARHFYFPEVFGYRDGADESEKTEANRSFGEGISWDTAYTNERIPEELREIRNTGTLFRDWEESAELFYFMYILETLK